MGVAGTGGAGGVGDVVMGGEREYGELRSVLT